MARVKEAKPSIVWLLMSSISLERLNVQSVVFLIVGQKMVES
jgi:hypothetical protein